MAKAEQHSPFAPAPLQDLPHYYGLLRPCAPRRYSRPRGWSHLQLLPSRPRRDRAQVLTFRTKAWSSFAPPTCRMPLGQSQASPELIPEEGSPPGFGIALSAFDTSSTVRLRSPLSTSPAEILVSTLTATLTTIALGDSSLQWFEIRPRRPTSKGPPSSLVQFRTAKLRQRVRDTRPNPDVPLQGSRGYSEPAFVRWQDRV